MNPKPLLLVALLGAALTGTWLALATGGGDEAPAPGGGPAAHAGDAPRTAAAPDGAALPAPAAPAEKAPADDGERTAVAADAPAGAPVPTVTIRGRLVDRAGAPRGDRVLELFHWKSLGAFDDFPLPPMPAASSPAARERPRVTTGADGTFTFRLAKDRDGAIHHVGADLVWPFQPPRLRGADGDKDLGDVRALAAGSIEGVVRDARTGQPVAGVKVGTTVSEFAFGMQSATTTDAEGRFRVGKLGPGLHRLRTASGSYLPVVEEVTLEDEEQKRDVVLAVETGRAVAGQVVDDRGVPVGGAKVGARKRESKGGVEMERFTPDEAITADANGWFTLAGLEGESTTVRAWAKGHGAAVERNVTVGTGNLVLRLQRHGAISGVLTAADGAPIAGSRVVASAGRGPALGGHGDLGGFEPGIDGEPLALSADDLDLPLAGRASAVTAEDGTFTIADVPPGTVTVRARGKTHRPAEAKGVVVAAAQTTKSVRLVADAGATAVVRVTDDEGKPVAGAKVTVGQRRQQSGGPGQGFARRAIALEADGSGDVHMVSGDRQYGSGTTDEHGVATIGGLPAGPASVTSSHDAHAEPMPADVVLPAVGNVELALAMRRPGFAELRVTEATGGSIGGTRWTVNGPLGAGETPRLREGAVDVSGAARVGPLPAGEYEASLVIDPEPQQFGSGMMFSTGDGRVLAGTHRRFTVVPGDATVVDIVKPVLCRVVGTVRGPDGPAPDCVVELEREAESSPGEAGPPDTGPSVRTDANGAFALKNLEAGRYTIRWGKPEQIAKASETITISAGTPEVRKDLVLRTGKLTVQAWSKGEGEPLEGAEVELLAAAAPGQPARPERRVMMFSFSMSDSGGESSTMTLGNQRVKTDADGKAEIADVPAGTWRVRVTHPGHVTREAGEHVVTEGGTTDAGRVEMDPSGRVRGKVLTADGKPAGMAMVMYRKVGAKDEQRQPAMGGSFRIDGLAPGRYALKAQKLAIAPGDAGGEQPWGPEVEIDVVASRTPATVDLTLSR